MTDEKITNNMDNRFYKLISQFDESAIKEVTPKWVVDDMLDLLPDEVWCRNTRFLDIYSKSGVFLYCIMEHLMTKAYDLIEEFSDEDDRKTYIVENQLFGLSWTNVKFADTTRAIVNRKASRTHHMAFIEGDYKVYLKGNGKLLNDELQRIKTEEFDNNMKFDVVVGNPPYNNDMYLEFVQLGYQLSSKYTCMITPAKWQAKGGEKNEAFRQNIVPHMSKIVYYPCCQEIFDIYEADGISYYLIDKEVHNNKNIKNISKIFDVFNTESNRPINDYWTLYNNIIDIIKKVKNNNDFHFDKYINNNGIYKVYSANKVGWSSFYTLKEYQKIIGVSLYSYLIDTSKNEQCPSADSVISFSSDSKDECISFGSFIRTKFVRFLITISLLGLTGVIKDEWWRFVPDPGAFDHIFTDEELYKKYNLTEEEINIIESVIKERK